MVWQRRQEQGNWNKGHQHFSCHNPSPSLVRGCVPQTHSRQAIKLARNLVITLKINKSISMLWKINDFFTFNEILVY